ncbi:MAG: pilus assembly protein, partial [Blastomonas sp.]|nr:pilus assembly protein [Blastomonas sp.]
MTIRTDDTPHRHDSKAGRAAVPAAHSRPLLNRLLASKRGNVLPIFAASILPMAAMIGGAVDMSRAYMVKSRIQQACDAGVLAGRRAMQQSSYSDAAKAQAQDFFDINFKEGYNESTNVVFNTSNPVGTSKVLGTASAVMPTAIMGMFGKETIEIDVACEAELNLSNSDVTFVLDVTGSMNDSIPIGGGGSIVKITALRNSVMSFYDTLANAATGSLARIRYAFVPYSTNVNVGELVYDSNPTWLNGGVSTDSWNYQSRRPIWNISTTTTTTDCQVFGGSQSVACPTRPHGTVSGGGTNTSLSRCQSYGDNLSFTGFSPSPSGNPTSQTSGNTTTKRTFARYSWGGAASNWSGSDNRQCVRQRTTETTTVTQSATWQAGATFNSWEYLQRTYPTFDFVRSIKSANPAVITPSNIDGSTSRWGGCIEERDTIAGAPIAYGSSGITVNGSTAAHDLNIDAVPNSAATRWRPYWEQVYYERNGSRSTACPTKARLLSTM